MRLRFFTSFLFILFLSFSYNCRAQQAGQQGQLVVSLPQKTGTIEFFLKALEAETKVPFSFSNEALPLQKKITLTGREKTLDEVLATLFKGTSITWLYRPDQVLLFEKPAENNPAGNRNKNGRYTVSGYVREAGSAEPLIGVTIYVPAIKSGIITNNYGFYSLTLPADSVSLQFSYVGYRQTTKRLNLISDQDLNVDLVADNQLKEVEIIADKQPRITQTAQTSQIQIPVEQVKDIPVFLGEKDVMKVVQLLPGVIEGAEGSSGLYVRGGGPDQNLIILDDATVYNTNHLFGLFSVFNGDALKNIEVTKGGFPARYGGRLSSVLDMSMKEGNKEKVKGEAGIGLVASRLMLEGPLVKNKASFLISGRRTYLDALVTTFMPDDFKFGYYFYDSNLKLNYDFGQKDKVYLSGYFGRDKFYLQLQEGDKDENMALFWGNATATARWNHVINDQLFANTSFIYSQFRFVVAQEAVTPEDRNNFRFFSGIRDITLKTDLDFYPVPEHYLKFGAQSTFHSFTPNALRATDSGTDFSIDNKIQTNSLETALYAEDFFTPLPKLLLNTGFRLSHFYTGKKHFLNPEPRVSAAYQLTSQTAIKTSFAAMNQYIHLLSSTGSSFPVDLWMPATEKVKPQRAYQVALGLAQEVFNKKATLEIEGYYKKLHNIITYRENASFLSIATPAALEATELNWEDKVTSGQGWSYGTEFLLQKKTGKLTGWLGYTLSHTQHQFDSLNNGKKFDARYDRRHDISITMAYKVSESTTLSANWVYGTGNAITLPIAEYRVPEHNLANTMLNPDMTIAEYGERNNFRVPAYHRLDFGAQFHKQLKWAERTWELSVYNLYNRKNPFFYNLQFSKSENRRVLRMVSMFPLIPSVSYNLKF